MLKDRHIVVVEDDDRLRASMLTLLRSFGCKVTGYTSADAYLLDIDANTLARCDCILSDVQMPGTDGLELLELLRIRPDAPPVVLMTAFSASAIRVRALQSGASCFLEKPVDDDVLVSCLEGLLDAGNRAP